MNDTKTAIVSNDEGKRKVNFENCNPNLLKTLF